MWCLILDCMSLSFVAFQNSKYSTMDAMCNDLDLVFMNAQQYNIEDSKLHQVGIFSRRLSARKT